MNFPEYRPDQSAHSGFLTRAENVYPATDGYRPMGSLVTLSDALAAAFQGGASALANDGTAYLLAGTASNLYRFSGGPWTSLVSGLTITGRWRFAQFKNVVITVNGAATRVVDLAAGTSSAIAGAPTGTCVAVIGDHVMIGQAGGDVTKVKWCAFNDYTGWTDAVDQAGSQPMQNGGTVMGIAGGEYGVILQRERIVRATRTGNALEPFFFDEISSNYGCAAAETIAQAGRTVFFYSDRGFMALDDGQVLKSIGSEKVDRTFAAQVSRDSLTNLYTAVDPQNKLVAWGVPGSPGQMWIYNFELEKWSTGSFAFTALFPGYTTSIGLEDLSALYPNLDTLPYSLDDPRWNGGNPRLYLVSPANQVGVLTGSELPAQIDTGFIEPVKGRRARIRNVRPITDAVSGMTAAVDARARLGDVENITLSDDAHPSGIIPIRCSGRYMAASLRMAAGCRWSYAQGLDLTVVAGGKR